MITPAELESFDDENGLEFENLPEKYKLHARKDLFGLELGIITHKRG